MVSANNNDPANNSANTSSTTNNAAFDNTAPNNLRLNLIVTKIGREPSYSWHQDGNYLLSQGAAEGAAESTVAELRVVTTVHARPAEGQPSDK